MNISYTYEVKAVHTSTNCMDVLFKSDGLPDVLVSARIPFEGEDADAVIRSFAPFVIWQPKVMALQDMQVGHSGAVEAVQNDTNTENANMWAQVEFEKQVAKALLKFGVLNTDPTAVEVTQL